MRRRITQVNKAWPIPIPWVCSRWSTTSSTRSKTSWLAFRRPAKVRPRTPLPRHAASQLARDVAVRAGERLVIRQLSSGALRSVLSSIGISVTQRIAGTAASRWLPIVGAAAVAGYAYFDTLQVAKTAVRMLEGTVAEKEVVGA